MQKMSRPMVKKKFNLKLDEETVDDGMNKGVNKTNQGFMGDSTLESIEL